MIRTILVNGTFRSGSGVVNDYLSSREDFSNPLGDNEFRIVSDPMGLQYLYNICYNNPGLLSSAYGFDQYIRYISNLQKYTSYLAPNIKGKLYNKKLITITNKFIKDPSEVLSLGQEVKAKIIDLDIPRKRISLSLKG